MTASLSTTLRNSRLSAIATACAGGSWQLRTGARPVAGPQAAATGTLLATGSLDGTPFATPSGGSMALADVPLTEDSAVGSGTAGYLRFLNSSSGGEADFRVTVTGGGGEATMPNTTVTATEPVQITVGTLSEPIGTEAD